MSVLRAVIFRLPAGTGRIFNYKHAAESGGISPSLFVIDDTHGGIARCAKCGKQEAPVSVERRKKPAHLPSISLGLDSDEWVRSRGGSRPPREIDRVLLAVEDLGRRAGSQVLTRRPAQRNAVSARRISRNVLSKSSRVG